MERGEEMRKENSEGKMGRNLIVAAAGAAFLFAVICAVPFIGQTAAADKKADDQTAAKDNKPADITTHKTLQGTLSGLTKRTINVVYDIKADKDGNKTEYEMSFTIPEKVKLTNVEKLSDLKFGNSVVVSYDEITEDSQVTDDKGVTKTVTKVVGKEAKEIKFLNRGGAQGTYVTE
jgi:hypothetical protein